MTSLISKWQRIFAVLLGCISVVSATSAGTPGDIVGLHAHFVGKSDNLRLSAEAIKNSATCPNPPGQPMQVVGPIEKIGEFSLDKYFSQDGAYMAEYQEGYNMLQTSLCAFVVQRYMKIKLYHNKELVLYEYDDSDKRPAWRVGKCMSGHK